MKKVRDPYWTYLREEEKELCRKFFIELAEALKDSYDTMASKVRNNECSIYLCPKGTTNQVTYHSKPEYSFRFSDHWNWYTSFKKNPDPKYIQCYTRHLPDPKGVPELEYLLIQLLLTVSVSLSTGSTGSSMAQSTTVRPRNGPGLIIRLKMLSLK